MRGGTLGKYGVIRFDMGQIEAQFDELYGDNGWTIDNVALATESSSSSSGSLKARRNRKCSRRGPGCGRF